MRLATILALFLFSTAVFAWSVETRTLSTAALQQIGVNTQEMALAAVSNDGRTVLVYDRPLLAEKIRGAKFRLWLFQLDAEGKVRKTRRINLDIPTLEQVAFTSDDSALVVVTAEGSKYLKVDLATDEISTLMEHVPGTPGFRAHPAILLPNEKGLTTVGHFYDEEDFTTHNQVVVLDPSTSGIDAFSEGPNVTAMERDIENLDFSVYASPEVMFFATLDKRAGKATMSVWTKEGGLKEIDAGREVVAGWGGLNSMVYSMKSADRPSEVVLIDADGLRNVIHTSKDPLLNLVVSNGGNTVMGTHVINPEQGITELYYATKGEGHEVKLVPGIGEMPLSVLRVAGDGSTGAVLNAEGLTVVRF